MPLPAKEKTVGGYRGETPEEPGSKPGSLSMRWVPQRIDPILCPPQIYLPALVVLAWGIDEELETNLHLGGMSGEIHHHENYDTV